MTQSKHIHSYSFSFIWFLYYYFINRTKWFGWLCWEFVSCYFFCLKASDTVYKDTTLFQPLTSNSPNFNTSSIKQAVFQFLHTVLAYDGLRWEGLDPTQVTRVRIPVWNKQLLSGNRTRKYVTLKDGPEVKRSVGLNTPNFTSKAKHLFSSLLL